MNAPDARDNLIASALRYAAAERAPAGSPYYDADLELCQERLDHDAKTYTEVISERKGL